MKGDQVAPGGIVLQQLVVTEYGSAAVLVPQEQPHEPPGDLVGDVGEPRQIAGAGRVLDLEVGA